MITNAEIDVKLIQEPTFYDDKKDLYRYDYDIFKSLKEPTLSEFVNSKHSQQHILLSTALDEVYNDDLFNGFPKLINWLDDNAGEGSSKFCCIRDSCDHGILDKHRAIKNVNAQFPSEFEFEDNVLKRDSKKNIKSMKNHLPEVLDHIKKTFEKQYNI